MARRKSLTDRQVSSLKAENSRYAVADPDQRGHYVRVTPNGAKSFVAVARDPRGKQVWATIGSVGVMRIAQARERARGAIGRIKAGLPPFEPQAATPDSFKAVAESYLQRHVVARGLRSRGEIERCLSTYIYPAWAERPFLDIKRRDVAALLDTVEDQSGPRQADLVLAIVRQICNWVATRDDDYVSPIVRGMQRSRPSEQARARVLDDDEIRTIWSAAEKAGAFGAIVRLCLLTAQRRRKVATMKWSEVSLDGTWRIAAEAREKGNGGELVLPEAALSVVRSQPRLGENPHVFPGRGSRGDPEGAFNSFSAAKRVFDQKVLEVLKEEAAKRGEDPKATESMAPWVIHDLRRTARSLMARAGVRPEIAERVLGHAIAGVEGVYDRHSYRDEKAEALVRLSALVDDILEPSSAKSTGIRGSRREVA